MKKQELFSEARIRVHVADLGKQISQYYKHEPSPPVLLVNLSGAFVFAADLIRSITIPIEVQFCKTKSYHNNTQGIFAWELKPTVSLHDRDVIIVEDIIDSGVTCEKLIEEITSSQTPNTVRIAALLYREDKAKIQADWIAFPINESHGFVEGYGLDSNQLNRNLKSIYKL
jgi:hypoxanthine phosphoribosyltransferase